MNEAITKLQKGQDEMNKRQENIRENDGSR